MAVEFTRVIVLLLSGFAFGMAFLGFRAPKLRKFRIQLGGQMLLLAAAMAEILQHVIEHHPFEWWLTPLVAAGSILTAWGIWISLHTE